MLKVAKFGGSSMADAKQFEKVRDIVRADPARKVIVVSAAGKRSADDHKLTDLLYLCYAHLQYGVNCDAVFQMICDRYIAIRDECGLNVDIEAELDVLRRQMRAGISLGMTYPQTMRYIVLPQAVKRIIPPLGNEFIAMLKDSSLVSVIGFEELTRSGQLVIAETYGTMEIWTCVAILYLVMTLTISQLVGWLEKRYRLSDER